MVPSWAAQTIVAGVCGQTSSAVRPDGKAIRAVRTQSGAPVGTRFW